MLLFSTFNTKKYFLLQQRCHTTALSYDTILNRQKIYPEAFMNYSRLSLALENIFSIASLLKENLELSFKSLVTIRKSTDSKFKTLF